MSVYLLSGTEVRVKDCNLYVDCDNEVSCYQPGPTTGFFVNPHIGIIADGGESVLEFTHESSEESCPTPHIGNYRSHV